MRRLIILRGPAGSGKTTVSVALANKIGKENTCILDLDITNSNENRFESNLQECMESSNVIGMMFYGNSHTTEPMTWISNFKKKDYEILSVILFANKEICFERCKNDNNTGRHPINKVKEISLTSKPPTKFFRNSRTRSIQNSYDHMKMTFAL
jgi:predicted ABC-type ATPase